MIANGVMFHHFHDSGIHFVQQGSISAEQLRELLEHIGHGNILSPEEWIHRAAAQSFQEGTFCLTFDDGLLSQYDIAASVLNTLGLKAFFFVYTSPMSGVTERLELYRYFRHMYFETMDTFYEEFNSVFAKSKHGSLYADGLKRFPENYLAEHRFYSKSDRLFRFFRDQVLGQERYFEIIDAMIEQKNLDKSTIHSKLWMTKEQIRTLTEQGHEIGLHSHTHPTRLDLLTLEEQKRELATNFDLLHGITGKQPRSAAHPCGRYNQITIDILTSLGIEIAFCSNMKSNNQSAYELARIDHIDLINTIQ